VAEGAPEGAETLIFSTVPTDVSAVKYRWLLAITI
jgi:hypothetical protein